MCGLFALLEDIEDRERLRSYFIFKTGVLVSGAKHGLRNELRVESSDFLRRDVKEGGKLVLVCPALSLVDLVSTVTVWIDRLVVSYVVNFVIEFKVGGEVIPILS